MENFLHALEDMHQMIIIAKFHENPTSLGNQVIPGNDQNTIPTIQGATGLNSIGQVSWRFMVLGGILKAF